MIINGPREFGTSRTWLTSPTEINEWISESNGMLQYVNATVYPFPNATAVMEKTERYNHARVDTVFFDLDLDGNKNPNLGYTLACEFHQLMKSLGDLQHTIHFTGGFIDDKASNFQALVHCKQPLHKSPAIRGFQRYINRKLLGIAKRKYEVDLETAIDVCSIGQLNAMFRIPGTFNPGSITPKRRCVICDEWRDRNEIFCECGTETIILNKIKKREKWCYSLHKNELDGGGAESILRNAARRPAEDDGSELMGSRLLDLSKWDKPYVPKKRSNLFGMDGVELPANQTTYYTTETLPPCIKRLCKRNASYNDRWILIKFLKCRGWSQQQTELLLLSELGSDTYHHCVHDEKATERLWQKDIVTFTACRWMNCPGKCGRSHPLRPEGF